MAHDESKPSANVQLDLNNEVFQQGWFRLEKEEQQRVLDTLKKISRLGWNQVYRDAGLKWEKIVSAAGRDGSVIYSLRITRSRRATALRQGNFMRLLTVEPDHDATLREEMRWAGEASRRGRRAEAGVIAEGSPLVETPSRHGFPPQRE